MKLFGHMMPRARHALADDYANTREELAHERADLMLRIDAATAKPLPPAMPDIDQAASEGANKIRNIGDKAEQAIDKVADQREDYAKPLRQFMLDRGIDRPARKSTPIKTTLVLQACLLIEAGATATLLAGDGYMSVEAGLLTGTVFSGINIATGLAVGFFGLRGSRFRAEAPESTRWDRAIRATAAGFAALGCAVMAGMHFAAARVRVVKDHTGIFDFEKVSLWATLNDYNALALLVIGGLSSALAVREGWSLVDPIWGFSRITKSTERQISDALDQAYDDGVQHLGEAFERAAANIEAKIDDVQAANGDYCAELQELREDVSRFNTDVELAVSRLKSAKEADTKKRQYVQGTGSKAEPLGIDLNALGKLIIDPALIPADCPTPDAPSDALDKLDDAFDDAIGKLDGAHASASSFVTHPFF